MPEKGDRILSPYDGEEGLVGREFHNQRDILEPSPDGMRKWPAPSGGVTRKMPSSYSNASSKSAA
jgi:hypothetical protein